MGCGGGMRGVPLRASQGRHEGRAQIPHIHNQAYLHTHHTSHITHAHHTCTPRITHAHHTTVHHTSHIAHHTSHMHSHANIRATQASTSLTR